MSDEKKITYERGEGEAKMRKLFSESNIQKFRASGVDWPESEGWVKVPQEVLDAEEKAPRKGKNAGKTETTE